MSDEQDIPSAESPEEFGRVTEPGTFRIKRMLPGPIERLWTYITDPEKRQKWFGAGPMEMRVGGQVGLQFRFSRLSSEKTPPGEADECDLNGRVTRWEPPRLLSYTWGEESNQSEVTFELFPRGREVLLVITHRRLGERGRMIRVASGWHTHLGLLSDHLNKVAARPFWSTRARMMAEYEQRISGAEI